MTSSRACGWRENADLKVSVRAGGHSWAAWSVRDDVLLIDLGRIREMAYDPDTGIATASPAVKGGAELVPFLTSHGRAFPGGHCPSVGIGGLPPPGRAGVEQPEVRLGVRERCRDRRRHRRR